MSKKVKYISLLAGFIVCFLFMYLIFDESFNKSLFTSLCAVGGMLIGDYIVDYLSKKKVNRVNRSTSE